MQYWGMTLTSFRRNVPQLHCLRKASLDRTVGNSMLYISTDAFAIL